MAVASDEPAPAAVSRTRSVWRWPLAAALLAVSALFSSRSLWMSESAPFRAQMTSSGIVAADKWGREQWKYAFAPETGTAPQAPNSDIRIFGGADPSVLAATSYTTLIADGSYRSGQLLWLTPEGALGRTFSFDDSMVVGGQTYASPWMLSDFSVDESGGRRRIAIAGQHKFWWPSVVTVLDEQWRRTGTFFNAGWVREVHWLSPDRLLISGFSNAHDGAMVGIVDVRALDGASPPSTDPKFTCSTCGAASPLRYVVMPRSEVNQASGSSLNAAIVELQDGRIQVRTIEVPRLAQVGEAIYEFSSSLDLISASYGDRYWEMHKTLEAEGKVGHAREQCPYRDGPAGIKAWTGGTRSR